MVLDPLLQLELGREPGSQRRAGDLGRQRSAKTVPSAEDKQKLESCCENQKRESWGRKC